MNRLKALFRRKRSIRVVYREVMRITLAEWQSSKDLVLAAQRALTSQPLRNMLDVLRTEHLAKYSVQGSISISERALHQARCEGYNLALIQFEEMGVFKEPKPELMPTYEPEELGIETTENK